MSRLLVRTWETYAHGFPGDGWQVRRTDERTWTITTDGPGHLREHVIVGLTYPPVGLAEHIAQYDPARVLAEVAAKRAICSECDDEIGSCPYKGADIAMSTLRLLASVYRDHADYNPAWVDAADQTQASRF